MAITRDTPWREIGPVDWDIWHSTITNAGGPSQLAAREAWIAANPHSALALAMLKQESSYGTDFDQNPASNRNPWNLKIPTGGGYVPYATWADGALGWRSRITSPTYKDGIYHNTRSIKDLIYVYAPPFDQSKTTTDAYIDTIVRLMNGWLGGTTPTTPPPASRTFTEWLDLMFGRGTWRITQDWAARGGPDLYSYAKGHGLDGQQHPGVDIGMAYGTKMYAPASGKIVCAGTGIGSGAPGGGCSAYNDWGDGSTVKQGVGRIEIYYPALNASLIYGHSRTVAVKPGETVERGQFIGTSGGMHGAHIHLEAIQWGTSQGWTLIDPRSLLAKLGGSPAPEPEPSTKIVFGRVPEPPYIDMPVHKDRPGQGYDVCPPRHNIGFVPHETQGRKTLEGYRQFFSCPSGERCEDALADWCCDRDGKAARYNDPNGTREPYASGGTPNPNDPTGFNRRFGSAKRNEILESCEFVKTDAERMTPAQIAWGGARAAFIADRDEQLWSEYPRPQKYGGVHMMPEHRQLSQTSCGQHPDDMAAMIATAKSIMRYWQVVEDGGTTPEPPSDYAPPIPIPELANADPDTAAAIVTDEGTDFVFVNDRVRAIRDTPRLQTANAGAKRVGRDVRKGQDFTVSWLFRARDGRFYFLTPAWTRLLAEDVERIRDKP